MNETEHHFAALSTGWRKRFRLACCGYLPLRSYPAPHVATLPAETPAADLAGDVEKSGGEEIIKLQRVDTLRARWLRVGCQWTSVARFSGWHLPWRQETAICRQGSCYILPN